MAFIKQYHSSTNTTYVYEQKSVWDKEKKQSRAQRKLIGKLDPVTGEIVPTGPRGRKKKDKVDLHDPELEELKKAHEGLKEEAVALRVQNQDLVREISKLRKENEKLQAILHKITDLVSVDF